MDDLIAEINELYPSTCVDYYRIENDLQFIVIADVGSYIDFENYPVSVQIDFVKEIHISHKNSYYLPLYKHVNKI